MSRAFTGKRFWLVGASEGLGRALAKALSDEGAHLVLSARSETRLMELANTLPHARALALDVTDADSIAAAARALPQIDGVIFNAGAYEPMKAQDWDSAVALKMNDVNYGGALRVIGAVLPDMLQRDAGDITLIGSLSAYHGLPAAVGYGPSKAALRSLAETLRFDLRGTGVVVRIVNPGFIKTRLTAKNSFKMPMLMQPKDAANRVLRAMKTTRFRHDFPRPFSWVIKALSYIPDWLIYRR
ncbi:SDR family NAD(P)-dependent oxidoreductase [Epibacterium sp. SM1969]|uniref:SDR family NAD(P)-dependent oxidoreductase n=1 Tax=Tritonibacter aquimaris TaxID=2663379 RepID=A0A844ALZ3_9RHOB|nr:SDR family NAD(P)-dependent oxidoreductase [Tritonibacter aquimaris]MQY43240.1 SDR family NAD(P)-dependent oxidoreductase [Tritonibacter aquimaris]